MPKSEGLSTKSKEELLKKIQADLPKDWNVRFSTTQENRVYFYNNTTGERTWKLPSKNKATKRKHDSGDKDRREHSDEKKRVDDEKNGGNDKHIPCDSSSKHPSKTTHKNKDRRRSSRHDSVERKHKKSKHHKTESERTSPKKSRKSAKRKKKSKKHDDRSPNTPRKRSKEKRRKKSHDSFDTSSSEPDIEMLDLTYSPDDEKDQEEVPIEPIIGDPTLFAIVDTNFLFDPSQLSGMHNLLEKTSDYVKFKEIQFIIPWVVIQELDKLKEDKTEARVAISFLNSHFRSHPKTIRGQTIFEAAAVIDGLQIETNDDRILQCCFHMQKAPSISVLLTKDINLMNKSIVNGFECFKDINSLLFFLLGDESERMIPEEYEDSNSPEIMTTHPSDNTGSPVVLQTTHTERNPKIPETPPSMDKNNNNSRNQKRKEKKDGHQLLLEKMLGESRTLFLSSLGHILEKEMKKAFGDLWLDVVLKKPPWRLSDVFSCINKHWLSVFKLMGVDRLVQYNLTNLIRINQTRTLKFSLNKEHLMEWVVSGHNLILGIQQRGKYDNPVKDDLISLEKLIEKLKSTPSEKASPAKPEKSEGESVIGHSSPEKMNSVELTEASDSKNLHSFRDVTSDPVKSTCDFWDTLNKIWNTILHHCAIIFKTLQFIPVCLDSVPEIACLMKEPCANVPQKSLAVCAVPLVIDVVKSIGFCLERLATLFEKKDPACESVFMDLLHAMWTTVQAFAVGCDLESLISDNLKICGTIAQSSEMIERIKGGYRQLGLVLQLLCECQQNLRNNS